MLTRIRELLVQGISFFSGGQVVAQRRVTTSAQVFRNDYIIYVETEGVTITLPQEPEEGQVIIIKDTSGQVSVSSTLIVAPTGDIDGAGSFSMTDDFAALPLSHEDGDWWSLSTGGGGGGGVDERVKVSSNDTTPGFLNGKLVSGAGITLTEQNDGANEALSIAATVAATEVIGEEFEISGPGDTVHVLANTPVAGSQRVYMNGQRLRAGAGNDYTIAGDTITMLKPVVLNDLLLVDYTF